MTVFANAAEFSDPRSRLWAVGTDLNTSTAIVDPIGNVLAYAKTGGILFPQRHELCVGAKLFRFSGGGRSVREAAKGSWWIEEKEFETLVRFAEVHGLAVGMAMRILCLVPPEWSDATLLIRARVVYDLLAWRGLGNSVITSAANTGSVVSLPHQNEIAARRVYQLFIPGLGKSSSIPPLTVEQDFPLDKAESLRGFLYL